MGEGLDTDLQSPTPGSDDGAVPPQSEAVAAAFRTLVIVGLAAASLGAAFMIARAALRQSPADPTTERIQALIDEANRLLKQLDEQKTP